MQSWMSPTPSTARRGRTRLPLRTGLLLAATVFALLPAIAHAQAAPEITDDLLAAVLPDAQRFSERGGDPPIYRGFATDSLSGAERLVGYAFLTSDIPPESYGYTAPIEVLVGMDTHGILTGARVVAYRESLRSTRGDFLSRPGIVGQFSGKSLSDPFRVRRDVESITGATITVAAMALGIRNAARRVAVAYFPRSTVASSEGAPYRIGTVDLSVLEDLTWPEMLQLELVREIVTEGADTDPLAVSLAYLRDAEVGELLVGPTRFPDGIRRAGPAAEDAHLMLLGINGGSATNFRPERLSFVQEADTVHVAARDFVTTGVLPDGRAQGEFRRTGLLLVDRSLDVTRPFTIVLSMGDEAVPLSLEYRVHDDPPVVAATPETPAPEVDADVGSPEPDGAEEESEAPSDERLDPEIVAAGVLPASEGAPPAFELSDDEIAAFLFEDEESEESGWSRTLAQTSWARVGWLLALLGVVTWAFVAKSAPLRWIALAGTIGYLGFWDRGFLSVSHILAGISVGPEVYLADVPLLILVVFTVGTTLFVGRVFCGFLCPFGALQDLLERVVPKSLRRDLPPAVHEHALYLKYGILGIVLLPAILGIPLTLFQYFEPFGTVFFWSPSLLLWGIAGSILVASAVVPRFYCRYACPLGAALAIGSLLAPFRIRRVEQCNHCKVCEQKCPTGAIQGPKIDFKECVRCNECEIQLIERAGVCRHDMERIRPRLVRLTMPTPREPVA